MTNGICLYRFLRTRPVYFNLDWQITVGSFALTLLESVEVHKSVDLLADTCRITLPGANYGRALQVEDQLKRGDAVKVLLGYDGKLETEFEGYLLNVSTDDGGITLNCEDALFLMRIGVADKSFTAVTVQGIAQYLIAQTGADVELSCTLPIGYSKFVIHQATAYDVLKKLQEETAGNIFMRWNAETQKWQLNIHPPYQEVIGRVKYSFQQNIETSSLKYVRSEDKKIEVVVESVQPDGQKKEERFGTSGGEKVTIKPGRLNDASLKQRAETEYLLRMTDGYEGDVAGWLIPVVVPGFAATIEDEDYEYKDGTYYVNAVTTMVSAAGGERKVQLGFKTGGNG